MKNIHVIIACVHPLVASGKGEWGTMKQKCSLLLLFPQFSSVQSLSCV